MRALEMATVASGGGTHEQGQQVYCHARHTECWEPSTTEDPSCSVARRGSNSVSEMPPKERTRMSQKGAVFEIRPLIRFAGSRRRLPSLGDGRAHVTVTWTA